MSDADLLAKFVELENLIRLHTDAGRWFDAASTPGGSKSASELSPMDRVLSQEIHPDGKRLRGVVKSWAVEFARELRSRQMRLAEEMTTAIVARAPNVYGGFEKQVASAVALLVMDTNGEGGNFEAAQPIVSDIAALYAFVVLGVKADRPPADALRTWLGYLDERARRLSSAPG